ncbi:MAG: DUF4912 domain-containing protein [Candidatus Eisenbacteria sp.]|nr:DUF4912 domain-containing protein [Candidatus Eisenbacteria bacterium]
MKKTELSGKTIQELRALAKASRLKGYSALKKAELVDLLAASASSGAQPGKKRKAPARRAGKPAAAKKRPSGVMKKPARAAKLGRKPVSERESGLESHVGRGLAPRTRRAFSLYRTLGEQQIKASKYYLGVQEAPDLEDGFMFPETHGEDLIVLMVRDPYWLFAYWEFSPDLNDQLLKRLGEDTLRNSRLVLRVYDVTGADTKSPVSYHDIDVAPGARDWYINVTHVESDYCIDIGLILPDGSFVVIARSNRISLPPIGPSVEVDEQWVTLESLGEIYSLTERGSTTGSGGWGSGGWGQG